MTGLDIESSSAELNKFVQQTVVTNNGRSGGMTVTAHRSSTASPAAAVAKQARVIEEIFGRVVPGRHMNISLRKSNRWTRHREAAIRAKAELERQEEIRKNLGDDAPQLSAEQVHSWGGDRASSPRQSGRIREVVEEANHKLNAPTLSKLGRRVGSEMDFFSRAVTEKAPAAGKPRVYRMQNDGSTFQSVQRGARRFAEDVFAGIRSPLAHDADREQLEQQALMHSAALDLPACWADESTLGVAA